MRGLKVVALAGAVVWLGAIAVAQTQKVTTAEQFDKVMKTVGPNNGAVGKAVKSNAYADAKVALGTVRQALALAKTFWVEKKIDEAIKLNDDALAKAEALDKVLGATPADTTAIMTAFQAYSGTCAACHKSYRVRDENGNYAINPEKVK